jgi:anti-anti-sigma factor
LSTSAARVSPRVTPQLCSVDADTETATVTVAGEIDHWTAPKVTVLGTWLLDHGRPGRNLTVCLRDVRFADSGVVGALETLDSAARAAGGRLRLVDVPPGVARVLRLAGAADLLVPDCANDDAPRS